MHSTFIHPVTSFQNEDAFAELYYSAYFSSVYFNTLWTGYEFFAVPRCEYLLRAKENFIPHSYEL